MRIGGDEAASPLTTVGLPRPTSLGPIEAEIGKLQTCRKFLLFKTQSFRLV